ncbi:MAG: nitroreductase [Coriobacteriales bacterium]|jgi:hypothetical protein|nr:nitroreductase [Coriobacteriales bacterium]
MNIHEAMQQRHSVRQYTDAPLSADAAQQLVGYVGECNQLSGMHLQLVLGDTKAFGGFRRLIIKNAANYLAVVGPDDSALDYSSGYWGEKVVLRAKQLGVDSCWFSMGAKKGSVEILPGEKMRIVVVLGYGAVPGTPHQSKPSTELCANESGDELPEWFVQGIEAALLAPTARNQQKFCFTLLPHRTVRAESLGGPFSDIDLGIACCHFEIGAGKENFSWADRID